MPVTHEPWLVVLSIFVAIQGAYVGLSLAAQIGEAVGLRRRLLLAGAAISLAVAIWSMHFVGMLAARLPFPVDYLVFPTLLSFLVCVIVVGAAVFAVSAGPLTAARLAAAAVFMGAGIVSMHYIGMWALHASAHMTHDPAHIAASVVVAIATSGLALWLAGGRNARPPLFLSAAALGFAIAGMHYTAMAGLALFPHPVTAPTGAPALSTDLLAIVVAIVAFVVSGIFLLALVPDRAAQRALQAPAEAAARMDSDLPHQAIVRQTEAASAKLLARKLPVQRDGATQYLAVEGIVAVHANAHYTYVFDGSVEYFCPLAISEVEARLDADRFVRVHRSHIVRLDSIVGLKRAGDQALIELAGSDRHTVPVSRARVAPLKSRLAPSFG
jgi:NO-binding membrane sensor protein with MHYT domain